MDVVKLVPNKIVAECYGITTGTAEVCQRDAMLAFLRPIRIRRRKYHVESELDEFDRRPLYGDS